MSDKDIRKATRHVNQNEGLIFERSSPGKKAYKLPPLDVPAVDYKKALGQAAREELGNMPEVSEIEIIRHFTRLSTWNYAIDLGMYPLGSCTMKYNARVNEVVARLYGLAEAHPYQPEKISQGALRVMKTLADSLLEITGMDAITLQPAAGAHGEMTGILLVRAHLQSKGNPRKKILIPDSAHGTNPATAAICGYAVENLKSNAHGMVDISALAAQMNEDVAGLMLTNPNTLGIFEQEIHKIADILHSKGGLLYMDGANMNALVGKTRPGDFGVDVMHYNLHKTFSTPHGGGGPGCGPCAVNAKLADFLPGPIVTISVEASDETDAPLYGWTMPAKSIGRLKAFQGNFGMHVRAYTYIRLHGDEGINAISRHGVLNANYIRVKLADTYKVPYNRMCGHEVVIEGHFPGESDIHALDISKRLMDYNIHPPTNYFPLIVPEALLIEPTESETKETLDNFVNIMKTIATEAKENPDLLHSAPHITPVGRVDEVLAAKQLVLCCRPAAAY